MALKYSWGSSPQDMYVICDSCGAKVHRSKTTLVNDRYSLQNGLVVCTSHLNEREYGMRPINTNETITSAPKYVRSESSDRFIVNANDDTVPTAPRNVRPQASTIGSYVDIYWEGPESIGSSAIESYTVYRSEPQLGPATPLVTGSPTTYYRDTDADVSGEYSYTVTATNGFGTSAHSAIAFYPTLRVDDFDVIYLIDENNRAIIDENGNYLVEETN
jgi:hypothetical protein